MNVGHSRSRMNDEVHSWGTDGFPRDRKTGLEAQAERELEASPLGSPPSSSSSPLLDNRTILLSGLAAVGVALSQGSGTDKDTGQSGDPLKEHIRVFLGPGQTFQL